MKSVFQNRAVPTALVLACLTLVGCGGGGSASSSLSGNVIDGYIEGAQVCLDLNNNLSCDAGEPEDTTAANGSYKLSTTGLSADQIKSAHLLTIVPSSAKDADDGGVTLAAAGKSGFSLLAPAAAYVSADGNAISGAVISPLTTLVSHEMISRSTPLATAQTYVRTRLDLSSTTDLTQDFVAKNETALKEKAQMLTVAIGEVKAKALADATAKPSDKQALFAALQYVQTQAGDLQKAFDAAKRAAPANAKAVDWVKTAIASETAKPVVADLLAEAKKFTESASVGSLATLIEQGFYSLNDVFDNCGGYCQPSYLKVQGSGGKISFDQVYQLMNGDWTKTGTSFSNYWVLTSTNWKQKTICEPGQTTTYSESSDGVTTVNFCSGRSERVISRKLDLSGKTIKQVVELNADFSGFSLLATQTLPSGSELYWLEFASTEDEYSVYTGQKASDQKTLDAFIQAWTTPSTSGGSIYPYQWDGLFFTFDAGGSRDGGRLTLWSGAGYKNPEKTGSATYRRTTPYPGQEVLILEVQAPLNEKGELTLFAIKDGSIYSGTYRSAAVRGVSSAAMNKTMANAILNAGKLPPVKD